jgi:hypothetical protein
MESYPSRTCRVLGLHPAGGKLPRRKRVASLSRSNALEYIVNFEFDPSRVEVAILEPVAPLTFFLVIHPVTATPIHVTRARAVTPRLALHSAI